MSDSRAPRNIGKPPPQRATARPPQLRPVAQVPKGDLPVRRARAVPQGRGTGLIPNPRTPKLVRDVKRVLGDLFVLFPDLPRPPRPAARRDWKRRIFRGGRP